MRWTCIEKKSQESMPNSDEYLIVNTECKHCKFICGPKAVKEYKMFCDEAQKSNKCIYY